MTSFRVKIVTKRPQQIWNLNKNETHKTASYHRWYVCEGRGRSSKYEGSHKQTGFRLLICTQTAKVKSIYSSSTLLSGGIVIYWRITSTVVTYISYDCLFGVWCCGLTTCFLYIGPLYRRLVVSDIVNDIMQYTCCCFWLRVYIFAYIKYILINWLFILCRIFTS